MNVAKKFLPECYLRHFFVVTITSLYEVEAKDDNGFPFARKIDLRDDSNSSAPVSAILSGVMLAIAERLEFFTPNEEVFASPEMIFSGSLRERNSKTSQVVGLFWNEEQARECFSSNDLKLYDLRWLEETMSIINAIGDSHPTICCSTDEIGI